MTSLTTPLSDDELDKLADFLDALPSPEAMNIEQMDGFFCALIVGPELVMPSEYWPRVLGADAEGAAFETMTQAQSIMELATRHWNTIARTLNEGDIHLPLFLGDEGGEVRGNDWAKGFMDGVMMRLDAWQSFMEDEEEAAAIVPIMALAHEDNPELKSEFEELLREDREDLLELMAEGVAEMYDYFLPMRAQPAPPAQPFVRDQPKVGRNEPCPCGSGKKYKQCCMTQAH
ncbi:UPF0149 family protein [Steroidobacter sp. S1-65]|uniref:UPF0149 family protein n=1 Tax=Steroidobacter gossypii TaxID=2805490 RepID=A0ABS1WWF3_9GAMM|nr:UPF0149 family protein [Steroidobacter gossypii]MBM0105283.1 UPF0149 family protein [Steroidobacter gossypii]